MFHMDSLGAVPVEAALSSGLKGLSFGQPPINESKESCMVGSGEGNLIMMTKGIWQTAILFPSGCLG
jgi:hypothetical protein